MFGVAALCVGTESECSVCTREYTLKKVAYVKVPFLRGAVIIDVIVGGLCASQVRVGLGSRVCVEC